MYEYEKKIAEIERKDPQITYKIKSYPTSKAGEQVFSTATTNEYSEIELAISLYYQDPNESEDDRMKMVRGKVHQMLAHKDVPGFKSRTPLFEKETLLSLQQPKAMVYGEDWDFDVERIEHDYSNRLTIDDIKAL